jgi:hypothetical protein
LAAAALTSGGPEASCRSTGTNFDFSNALPIRQPAVAPNSKNKNPARDAD